MIRLPYSVSKHYRRYPRRKGKGEEGEGLQKRYLLCVDVVKSVTSSGKCLDGEKKDEKRDEKEEDKRNNKSKLAKGNEEANSSKAPSETLYTAVPHNALVST